MLKKVIVYCIVYLSAAAAYAATAVAGNTVYIDFGTFVLPASIANNVTVTISPNGTVSTSGGITQHTGGKPGSFTINASDGGAANAYASVTNSSHTGIGLLGCGGSVLSTANISGVQLRSSGPVSTPGAVFYYGATLSFNQLLSGGSSLNCTVRACTSAAAFYYNLNAPATASSNNGNLQLCFTMRSRPTPISLTHTGGASLNFGRVCAPWSGNTGTITVTPSGAVSASNVECYSNNVSADSFSVTGAANSGYSVILPSSVNINNGSRSLTINNFTSSCTNCTLGRGGSGAFSVGGTLSVPSGTSAGTYSGSYTVSVVY